LRGRIIKALLASPQSALSLAKNLGVDKDSVRKNLRKLTQEGLVVRIARKYGIKS
jgi:predicted ArsR family transcriptional regulator